jgi:putative restriction endonuclease
MRVLLSEAVNGNGIVGKLFGDFAGKQIALPMMKGNYPREEFVEWHRREVFRE